MRWSRSGRAPRPARRAAGSPAAPRSRGRCTGAAAGRRTGRAPLWRSLSLTSSHSAARRSADSTRSSSSRLRQLLVEPDAEGDVVVDRHRERRRLLEHHADLGAQQVEVDARRQDVLAVDQDFAARALVGIELVDAVEDAQQGRLAAARRADKGGHPAVVQRQADILQRLELCRSKSRRCGFAPSPAVRRRVRHARSGAGGGGGSGSVRNDFAKDEIISQSRSGAMGGAAILEWQANWLRSNQSVPPLAPTPPRHKNDRRANTLSRNTATIRIKAPPHACSCQSL